MFSELFPIVATTDMARALAFYRDGLGGAVTHEIPGADGAPVYVGIDIGASHMGIGFDADAGGTSPGPISVWIYADDCDAAVDRLRAIDVSVVQGPTDQPSGDRVARVLDPDGNVIIIGQREGGSQELLDSVGASLLSPDPTNYTRPEYERRFLVSPGSRWRELVEPHSKTFEDIYLRHTRLRLRILADSSTGGEFIKLTKKLESTSPYVQMIGSIPLSPIEYEFLADLEGDRISKVRYYHFYRGHVFSIDVFQGELAGLVLCEVETGSIEELMRIEVPDYALAEVTEDPFFAGGNLCRTSRDDLKRMVSSIETS
ncbi:MAG: glyoxalase superfamily protein [Gemmatimonadota bacterium]